MILAESPRRQRVTKLVNWGHWFALANIILALVISSVFVFSSPATGTPLGNIYLFANWFGHIGFLTFCGFVIFILPQCYWVTNPNIVKGSGTVIAAVGLALLAFDALIYNRTGFHITLSSAELVRSETQNQLSAFSWQQWAYLGLLFVVWLGFQLVLANAIWKRIDRLVKHKIGTSVTTLFVLCFVSSHAMHVWADARLYQPIIKQDNMFPLSYPATAKTLLSRYELLDLESYQQRKQLQFDPQLKSATYPLSSIFCSIDPEQSTAIFVQTDNAPIETIAALDLRQNKRFYMPSRDIQSLVHTTLFGAPEIYAQSLNDFTPVIFDMAEAFNLPVIVDTDPNLVPQPGNAVVTEDALRYVNTLIGGKLVIVFASAAEIDQWLSIPLIARSHLLIATGFDAQEPNATGTLYSSADIVDTIATTEDILPTALHMMGCEADTGLYSTGQNLLKPIRNWVVTTSGEKIILMHGELRTEIMSNGSYEITNLITGDRSTAALNTDLLSQAIKHLSRFSAPQ
ncbi:DUF3413 domain-containing protein [Alteromonas sp. ASW11-36]|uniref:DUF3413 domain-containing protein n=1 Tax=Alteromonas arenosi TaxID=3055817 RepID=A0ABT7SXW4_9ALTE|nr:DUF3413 domain-containing protein [Alteromonas sp. ASW11-36]MDM7861022.1 DUF3413 domain-containing protein [Alteromonas sp. ASW11-36]